MLLSVFKTDCRAAVDISVDDLEVTDNPEAGRFEVRVGNDVAFVTYAKRGSTIAYLHTEVPMSLEGQGIAGKLAKYALDYARENRLDVVPICPYVADYIRRHPEYDDLVAPRNRWKEFLTTGRGR
jgi:predicted GNAT family acetyltransferase